MRSNELRRARARVVVALASVGALVVALAGCSPSSTQPVSKSLTVAVSSLGKESIDPSVDTLATIGVIGAPIYDWLAWPKKNGTLGPGLANSWTEGPNHLSWTINLKSGAKFSDGTPVTADDVKFSIELHLRPDATSSLDSLWRSRVTSITVNSPTNLTVNLKSPWPTFPEALSPYEGAQGAVVEKAAYEKEGAKGFAAAPVGSGPWTFVSHALGQSFTYKAGNPNTYRQKPAYNKLTIKLVTEDSTRLSELTSGSVQIAEITPDQVAQVKAAGLQVLQIPNFTDTGLTFFGLGDPRMASQPTGDVRVREALALGIDRNQMLKSLLDGYGTVSSRFIVGKGSLGYDPSWKPLQSDITKAKQLLAEAGYPGGGFTVKFYSASIAGASWIPQAVQAIAGYWAKLGVKTQIVQTDYGSISSLYRQRPLPASLIGAAMINVSQVTNTNITLLDAYYPSSSVVYLAPTPEMDALNAKAAQAVTTQELGKAITNMVNYANTQYIAFPLFRTPTLYGAATSVKGWVPYRSGYIGMMLNELHPGS